MTLSVAVDAVPAVVDWWCAQQLVLGLWVQHSRCPGRAANLRVFGRGVVGSCGRHPGDISTSVAAWMDEYVAGIGRVWKELPCCSLGRVLGACSALF